MSLLASARRWAQPSSPALADWRRFFDPRFRAFHVLAVLQGLMVLAGFEVVIPFAIDIGCPPALTALLAEYLGLLAANDALSTEQRLLCRRLLEGAVN